MREPDNAKGWWGYMVKTEYAVAAILGSNLGLLARVRRQPLMTRELGAS